MNWLSSPFEALQRWRAMRELRALETREASDYHWDFDNLIEQARDLFDRGNRPRAIEIWNQAAATFPDLAMLSDPAFELLIWMNLFDKAEELMNRAVRRHPRSAHPLEGLALIAYKRGDPAEAVRRCEILRKEHVGSLKGFWIGSAALSELGRDQDAEALLARGMQANPNDVGLRIEYAKLAERRQDWEEALKRWTIVLHKYEHVSGAVGIANVQTELGRYEEADKTLADITYKWGNHLFVWVASIRVAQHKQDWEEAARRWAVVRGRFPMEPMCYSHSVATIEKTAHPEQADEVLRAGMEQIPYDAGICVDYAWLAHRRGDLAEAARRWGVVRERFPDRREGYEKGADALAGGGDTEAAAAVRAIAPAVKS
jgi:tetratricopeptide (TPR) repeat protein